MLSFTEEASSKTKWMKTHLAERKSCLQILQRAGREVDVG